MSNQACKAARCAGQCLAAIVVNKFRELTVVTRELAANGQLTDEQLEGVIALYTRYEGEVERRTEADMQALAALEEILH
jgi:hypothetical protein